MGNKAARDARRIDLARRAKLALELRCDGLELEEIAPQVGLQTRSGVMKLINREIAKLPREGAEALRVQQTKRALIALKALMPMVRAGNLDAIDRWARVEKRLAELHGLDAPKRAELSGPEGGPIEMQEGGHDELIDRLARLAAASAAIGDREPPDQSGGG